MSGFAEYEHYDALGLADLVRRGQISADTLLDAAIARVEAGGADLLLIVGDLVEVDAGDIEDELRRHRAFREPRMNADGRR